MNGGNQPVREVAVSKEMASLCGSIDRLVESTGVLAQRLIMVSQQNSTVEAKPGTRKEPSCPLACEIANQRERIETLVTSTQSLISALEI